MWVDVAIAFAPSLEDFGKMCEEKTFSRNSWFVVTAINSDATHWFHPDLIWRDTHMRGESVWAPSTCIWDWILIGRLRLAEKKKKTISPPCKLVNRALAISFLDHNKNMISIWNTQEKPVDEHHLNWSVSTAKMLGNQRGANTSKWQLGKKQHSIHIKNLEGDKNSFKSTQKKASPWSSSKGSRRLKP